MPNALVNAVTQSTKESETRGGLTAARIFAATPKGKRRDGPDIGCLFNPYEYKVSKSNTYSQKDGARAGTKLELQNSGPQTLSLSLIFDGVEGEEKDVSKITEQLWELMKPVGEGTIEKPGAPFVVFQWGVFHFVSVITNMTQNFILFDKDGTPLRAKVDITFTQHVDRDDDYVRQNLSTGAGLVEQTAPVVSGDRLDSIAAQVYGDAGKWRLIAEQNQIIDPLSLRPGQRLLIPEI